MAAFEEVLRQDYGQFQAHLGLGVALVRLGRLEEARFAFDQMTRVFPDRYEGHFNLGQVYLRLGEAGKAAEAFAKAAAIAPREEAYLAWSGALLQEGKAREAAAVLERGLSPERSPAYRLALAQALYAAGEREAAVPHLYAALNREPGRAEAWDLLARVLAEVGLTDRARREVERARGGPGPQGEGPPPPAQGNPGGRPRAPLAGGLGLGPGPLAGRLPPGPAPA